MWKCGDPIASLTIQGVRIDISLYTTSRFLYRPYYLPPVNAGEMDYQMEEIRKITWKKLGWNEKMGHFRCISEFIVENGANIDWVARGLGVASCKIEKHMMTFEAKE